jgi:uncharacterized protein YjbI with pentapeptide repeats
MTPDTITLPIAPEHFWMGAAIVGLLALSALIYWVLEVTGRDYRRPTWEDIPESWRGMVILLGLLWLGLFGLTVMAAYAGVWQMTHPKDESSGAASGLGFGALLAAMLGAPFVIWGTVIKHKTLSLSETSLFNDKVNAAVAALHSRRQVTREITVEGEAKILTEWQDDIVQRSAAIDRLEGLMRERPSEAPRIVNMLSVYIRELSREFQTKDHPRTQWLALVEPEDDSPPMDEDQALYKLGVTPDDVTVEAMKAWARGLRPFRTDVEKAAQTLGRVRSIPNIDKKAIQIDLSGMNGQGFDLMTLDFSSAKLIGARLEGADLVRARLEGATFWVARLEGANLGEALLEGADLGGAWLEGADLWKAQMGGANLYAARLEGADLGEARLEGANLREARLDRANLYKARLEGANLREARLERANLSAARLERANLGEGRLEGAELSAARLEGAHLWEARLDRANLSKAHMDASTNLTDALLSFAAVRLVDYADIKLSQDQIEQMFGDGSVKLPEGVTRPAHWPDWELVWDEFPEEWRKWRDDPSTYTPPPKPE